MSEIPLRSFRRARKNRDGYSPLPEDEEAAGDEQPDGTMPFSTRAAVAASSARNAQRGRRRDHYEDDSEEATLLGEEQRELHDDVHVETASQVRPPRPLLAFRLHSF